MKTFLSLAAGVVALGFAASAIAQEDADPALFAALMEEGDDVFHSVGCSSCHGDAGEGGNGPRFVGNALLGSTSSVVTQILAGNDYMPGFGDTLSDWQLAAVATYVRNSWGNEFGVVNEEAVAARR